MLTRRSSLLRWHRLHKQPGPSGSAANSARSARTQPLHPASLVALSARFSSDNYSKPRQQGHANRDSADKSGIGTEGAKEWAMQKEISGCGWNTKCQGVARMVMLQNETVREGRWAVGVLG